jgi:hypothetical protein
LPKLFFLFLPLFALLLHVLLFRERTYTFEKPFIFSAHFHAFVFLAFTLYGLISRLFIQWGWVKVNALLISLFLLYTLLYLWLALRAVYPRALVPHSARFLALLLCYGLALVTSSVPGRMAHALSVRPSSTGAWWKDACSSDPPSPAIPGSFAMEAHQLISGP